jgi:hypothetical protein
MNRGKHEVLNGKTPAEAANIQLFSLRYFSTYRYSLTPQGIKTSQPQPVIRHGKSYARRVKRAYRNEIEVAKGKNAILKELSEKVRKIRFNTNYGGRHLRVNLNFIE